MVTAFTRSRDNLPAALLFFFLYCGHIFWPASWRVWPLVSFLFSFVATFCLAWPFVSVDRQFAWFRRGKMDPASSLIAACTGLLSAGALLLWAAWTNYFGAGEALAREAADVPLWFLLILGVPGFAFLNALLEESIYRGVLLGALDRHWPRRPVVALCLHASLFAAAHYAVGFPNGLVGYVMTFLYALALGVLKRRTEGLLLPFLTHFAADLLIGYTLVWLVR